MNSISELQVYGCGNCPFRDEIEEEDHEGDEYTQHYCKHPKRYLVDLYEGDDGVITPGDCPLRASPITIQLKQE